MATTRSLTPDLYAVLSSTLDSSAMPRILASFGNASQNNVQHLHVLFQSTGGVVHEGIRLYNFFKNFSIDLILYNMGVVSSVAVIPYLGAKTRKVSRHATFMIRRTQTTNQVTNNDTVEAPADSVVLFDETAEAILREHINMPANRWAHFSRNDLWFSAEQAVKYGIAHEIGDFAAPADAKIWTI
jgi:ATP-dependent Clp protease, protease subunit